MGKVTNIRLPNGFSISCESDDAAGVPDITQNAGENVMEAQDDAQKPVTQDAAEYDAAAEADTKSEIEAVQEVAKANESTFFGLAMMKRSQEGFGIKGSFKKMKFSSPQEAVKSSQVQEALKTAEEWAQKKGYKVATFQEIQTNKQTWGTWLFKNASKKKIPLGSDSDFDKMKSEIKLVKTGNTGVLATPPAPLQFKRRIGQFDGSKYIRLYVMFVKKNGKVFAKSLAVYQNTRAYNAVESAGLFDDILNDEYATESLNNFFGFESDDADETTIATAETSDTETTVTAETEETPAEEETTDVNVEAESEEEEETPAEEEEKESSSAAEADDEEKAIENFFANWGL